MKQNLSKKIVLFDFDGVIVDSFEISYQVASTLYPMLTREMVKNFFNDNTYKAKDELEESKTLSASEKTFFEKYVPKVLELSPIKGMKKTLRELGTLYQLIVVSSTISSPINGYLAKYDLAQYFDAIMGGDVHKSKTVKIQMVLDQSKTRPEECVFITDTLGDMKEAAECNVQSIGVTWGFHERKRLEKGNFFALVDTIEELSPAIHSFFARI